MPARPQKEVVLLIAILAGAVFYFAFIKQSGRTERSPNPTATNSSQSPTTSLEDKAIYKTYSDTKYGFELTYPENWSYDNKGGCGDNCVGFTDGKSQDWSASALVYDASYEKVKEDIIANINSSIQLEIKEDSLRYNNILWTRLTLTEKRSGIVLQESYFTERIGRTYELRASSQILTTFKFTN